MSLFFLVCSTFTGCEKAIETIRPGTYTTEIFNDVTKLFSYAHHSSTDSVIIFVQGGPLTELEIDFINTDGVNSHSLKNFTVVYPHQVQTLHRDLLEKDLKLKTQDFVTANNKNVEILNRVINHFKEQNKKIFLMGHSYGGFLAQEYLYQYGNTANKTLILGSRLDIEELVSARMQEGKRCIFKDGINPQPFDEDFSYLKDPLEVQKILDENTRTGKLAAVLTRKRFTKLLHGKDLSKVIYVYGENDEITGRLSSEEINFLIQNNSNYKMLKISADAHHDMIIDPENFKQIISLIRKE